MLAKEPICHWIDETSTNEEEIAEITATIDAFVNEALSEKESSALKMRLQLQETSSVRRYLHLKISDSVSLFDYLECGKKELFAHALAEASLASVLRKWLSSFSILLFSTNAKAIIRELREQDGSPLPLKAKYLLAELLEEMDKQIDPLDYLHQFASHIELLLLLEEELHSLLAFLYAMPDGPIEEKKLLLFENALIALHKEYGYIIGELFLPLGNYAQASWMGTFRLLFEEINSAYNQLRSRLTGQPSDLHITCFCHFAPDIQKRWPLNNRVICPSTHNQTTTASTASLLIFTCGGGQGHLSATKAMTDYAKGHFHIYVANTLEETLAASDPLRKIALNLSQEKLYNRLLKNEEYELLKLLTSIGPFFLMLQQERLEQLIRLEVLRHSPDVLISCFPIFNGIFLKVAKEFDLPLLIVTTDLDASLFTKGISECDYARYRFTLAYEDAEMRRLIERHLPRENIAITGFPVRSSFTHLLSPEECQAIRNRYQIAPHEKVILIIMGGNASRATEKYAQILAQLEETDLDVSLQVLCLCGDQAQRENCKMLRRINQLVPRSPRVKLQGLPATEEIAALMSIADILITKPGGCTTNEAIAKGLPMIFHAPFALMDWEVFNMEFCIRHNLGARFRMHANTVGFFQDGLTKNKERLLPLIKEALQKRASHNVSFDRKVFKLEFLKLIYSLL